MAAYYNEIEPFAAQWLRNLIAANLIAPGDVDERSIRDVQATDLRGYRQCHFFAGIGVWSHTLRLAGWPDDREVWTGSCPCQPFSVAGAGKGTADERHLWPEFFRLIRECRPATVIGEQVAGPAALAWLDLVSADLEGAGYAVGAADICAAGCGAPHIRQRLYWVANNERDRPQGSEHADGREGTPDIRRRLADEGDAGMRLADPGCPPGRTEQLDEQGQGLRREPSPADGAGAGERGGACILANSTPGGQRINGGAPWDARHAPQCEPVGWMANDDQAGRCLVRGIGLPANINPPHGNDPDRCGPLSGPWSNASWLPCTDGKARPVEPGTFPLAHGVAGRVGRLRAYGNALCAPVAKAFVEAVMECVQ